MRFLWMLLPAALSLPLAARAEAVQADVAAFVDAVREHVGERVTLHHCHLVYATADDMTCIGLAPGGAAGDLRAVGKLLIVIGSEDRSSRARALAQCGGGSLDEACDVSVSGEVFDSSRSFGLEATRVMGLREASIGWPGVERPRRTAFPSRVPCGYDGGADVCENY